MDVIDIYPLYNEIINSDNHLYATKHQSNVFGSVDCGYESRWHSKYKNVIIFITPIGSADLLLQTKESSPDNGIQYGCL